MSWVKSEYILKGVFLGLLLFVSLQKGLDWGAVGRVAFWLGGGLVVALVVAAGRQFRNLRQAVRHPLGFLLFLLLENPVTIYAGVIFGMAGAAIDVVQTQTALWEALNAQLPPEARTEKPLHLSILGYCVLGGALFGYGLAELRQIVNPLHRLGVTAILCSAVGIALYYWLDDLQLLGDADQRRLLGGHLLLGLPFFYLLVFCGLAEESEVEIAALCVTLGLGIYLVQFPKNMPALGLLLPVTLYGVYSIRILRPLRVFKHALRGLGHAEVGRIRDALEAYNRALQLDPNHALARHGLIRLHRGLSIEQLDPETRAQLNPYLVIDEAARPLLAGKPSAEQLREATELLSFVERQWPAMKAQTDYYKAIAETHAGHLDDAVERLSRLLDPTAWPVPDRFREAILFSAWQLALRTHPELKKRVGDIQLPLSGRVVEALRAVERQLRLTPDDPVARSLREELFTHLTEEEYARAAADGPLPDFPYAYAEERGLPLLDDAERWRTGALYVRIAAHGQPERGPGLFQKLADAATRHGDLEQARRFRLRAREFGLAVGPGQLSAEERAIFFAVVKKLGDEAAAARDWKEAIRNYTLLLQSETSGKETLRTLAQMYENDGQVLPALRCTEDALTRGADKDLLERKDKYYYSVDPDLLRSKADEVRNYFDVKYCVKKAKSLLDAQSSDLDVLDWATHLIRLALVMEPKNLVARVQMARCQLRRGERDEALRLLEDVREMKPSGNEEREAYEWTLRQLGALYLDDYHRPDLAVECLKQFLDSEKSGARTLYDLGRAHEALGNLTQAMNYYQQAAAYEDNPIRWDAEEAIRRIRSRPSPSDVA